MECPETIFTKYASVLLDGIGIGKTLDYGIPAETEPLIRKGSQVKVLLKGQIRIGIVTQLKESADFSKVLPIHSVLSEGELLTEELFSLAHWIEKYYCTPQRHVIKIMLPSSIRHSMAHKEQYFISSLQTKNQLRRACAELQEKQAEQAAVLEVMLKTKRGILLTELLEKSGVSVSPVETLIKRGFLKKERMRIDRNPLEGEEYFKTVAKPLNDEQKQAYLKIIASLQEKRFETHLLYGITGSGKTEVYLQAIEKALEMGLGTIMLVPEISLTAQTIDRFRSRFDDKIAILHHRLSQGERCDEWHRIRRGDAQIVVGARSALFSPLPKLGLIIVDEEHDGAYKQSEEAPCYHARDLAVVRGKITHSTVILGSATPSLESYYNTLNGKYTLSKLSSRATQSNLPHVTIVDMKKEYEKAGGYTAFSAPLLEGIKKRFAQGEQTILFLNRRGYHTSLFCEGCGHIFKCPHCDLALTFHFGEKVLACHLCDFRLAPIPSQCPECKKPETLKYKGVGTEQIERALHAIFPDIRTIRMDGDTTRHKGSHEHLLKQFSTAKADVLIGTQMIAKGLHFPSVTLVAILNCDGSLQIPDFRASENIFQLITQVAGRAGRGELPGEVIIQTHLPDNQTIKLASAQNYEEFYKVEIASRKMFGFPPFSHLVKLTFVGKESEQTAQAGAVLRAFLAKKLDKSYLLHPLVPSGYPKIKDFYRFQLLIRGKIVYPIHAHLKEALAQNLLPKEVRMHIDVDPLSTFF